MTKKGLSFPPYDDCADLFATFSHRLLAMLIDFIVLVPFIVASFFNLFLLQSFALHFVLFGMIFTLKVLAELFLRSTLGKFLVGIVLVNPKFEGVSNLQIWKRNILFVVYFSLGFVQGLLYLLKQENDIPFHLRLMELEGMLSYFSLFCLLFFICGQILILVTPYFQSATDLYAGTYLMQRKSYLDYLKKGDADPKMGQVKVSKKESHET